MSIPSLLFLAEAKVSSTCALLIEANEKLRGLMVDYNYRPRVQLKAIIDPMGTEEIVTKIPILSHYIKEGHELEGFDTHNTGMMVHLMFGRAQRNRAGKRSRKPNSQFCMKISNESCRMTNYLFAPTGFVGIKNSKASRCLSFKCYCLDPHRRARVRLYVCVSGHPHYCGRCSNCSRAYIVSCKKVRSLLCL